MQSCVCVIISVIQSSPIKETGKQPKNSYNDVKGKKTSVNMHMIQDYKLSLSGALLILVDFL